MALGIIIGVSFMAVVTIALAVTFFTGLSRLRTLSRTSFDPISTLAKGTRVAVRGTVTSANDQTSPISKEPCAWFACIAKTARSTKHGKRFSTTEDLRSESPFIVHDATGSISVDPHLAFVAASNTRHYWISDEPLRFAARRIAFGQRVPLDPTREGKLISVEKASSSERFRARVMYDEHIIKEGEEVICAGVAEDGPRGIVISSKKSGVIASPDETSIRRRKDGVIAIADETRTCDELKSQVIMYGIALGVIGTLFLNLILITLISFLIRVF
jgi:hypothetical protein